MILVAMDIIFEGEDAEKLREDIKRIVTDLAFKHTWNADIEITSWDATHDPIVVKK